jgi:hypothetical protein
VISLGIATTILFGFNAAIMRFARTSVPRRLVRQMDETRGLTHLALGNSLMAAGFNRAAFDEYLGLPNAVAFNAGLGSSYPVEHLILLRRALRDHPTVNTLIYGFFDLQLTGNSAVTTSDLVGNRACQLLPGTRYCA